MFIDIGVSSKEEAELKLALNRQYGNAFSEFEFANDKYLTAAFDNRYGCALIEVLKRLKDENIGINLYSGATVQEEVGFAWCESGSEYN